jgi:hypothetical protein
MKTFWMWSTPPAIVASTCTSAATAASFNRIDHLVLSNDTNQGYALRGELNSPFKKYVEGDSARSVHALLTQSSLKSPTDVQSNAQQEASDQQQV